ncbi:hypothetical protein MKW94_006698 [Papaver nudicaule]|uniref:Uncharacterized protein n=1 Tax=Papaver nudicaule TaxID=74823 RepID=A0AA41RR68_PAPNU|nr:hypothetical protein [Papaver nudicaule]
MNLSYIIELLTPFMQEAVQPTLVGFREDTLTGKFFSSHSFPCFQIRFIVACDTENCCAAFGTKPRLTFPPLLSFNKKWNIVIRCSFVRSFLFLVAKLAFNALVSVSSAESVVVSEKHAPPVLHCP